MCIKALHRLLRTQFLQMGRQLCLRRPHFSIAIATARRCMHAQMQSQASAAASAPPLKTLFAFASINDAGLTTFGSRRYALQPLRRSHGALLFTDACHTSSMAGHDSLHSAAMALQAHLQEIFEVRLSDAAQVVEKAPKFVSKLVALVRDWQLEKLAGKNSPAVELREQVSAYLKDTHVSVLEAVLESLDVHSDRAHALLTKLSSEPKDVQALLYLIKRFQRLGVPRSKFGQMLEQELGILAYTQEQIEVGTKALKGLGMSREDVSRLLLKFPLILSPQFVSNVRCLKTELKAFPAKIEIIRDAVCQVPHKVYECSEGGARAVVQFLRGLDWIEGDVDINTLFVKCSRLVVTDVSKLKANLEFFLSLGFMKEHLTEVIFRRPALLVHSVEDNIKVKCDYFRSLGLANDDLISIIARYPQIFGASLEKKIRPLLNEVRNLCLNEEGPKKVVLYRPSVFAFSLRDDVSTLIEYVKAMDCSEEERVGVFVRSYCRRPKPEALSYESRGITEGTA